MDITIVNKMLVKKYFDDNVHIKENFRLDALKKSRQKQNIRLERKENK